VPPPIVGQPVNYYQKWDFVVEIDGTPAAGFTEATGLEIDQKIAIQREGGVPGIADIAYTSYDVKPITLSRGGSNETSLYDWWESIRSGVQDKRNVSVVQQKGGVAVRRTNYTLCALTSYKDDGNDRSKEEENVIESITLQPTEVKRVQL
jgi:phage tail-like protein